MKYPFTTKFNGVYYPANTEIPCDNVKADNEPKKEAEKAIKETVEIPKVLQQPTEIEKLANEEKVKIDIKNYKKTEINRMRLEEIKDLARRLKIDGYEEMSGGQLKKLILEMSAENYAED